MLKQVAIAGAFVLAVAAGEVAEARGRGGCPNGACSMAAAPAQAPAKKDAQAADAPPAPEASANLTASTARPNRVDLAARTMRFRRAR